MSVKAASVVERSEGAAQKKLPGAVRGPVRLVKLLRGVEAIGATAHGDLEIAEIAYDSRKVKPGTLFVAVRGEKTDGNKFVGDAMARGAAAIVSEEARPESIPAEIPAEVYRFPSCTQMGFGSTETLGYDMASSRAYFQ